MSEQEAAKPGTLPRNVCHLCRRLWTDCLGTCGAVSMEVETSQCEECVTFFARFRCNKPDECDCPKCQNYCTCEDLSKDKDEPDEGNWSAFIPFPLEIKTTSAYPLKALERIYPLKALERIYPLKALERIAMAPVTEEDHFEDVCPICHHDWKAPHASDCTSWMNS